MREAGQPGLLHTHAYTDLTLRTWGSWAWGPRAGSWEGKVGVGGQSQDHLERVSSVSSVDDVGLLREELAPFTTELSPPVAEEWETLETERPHADRRRGELQRHWPHGPGIKTKWQPLNFLQVSSHSDPCGSLYLETQGREFWGDVVLPGRVTTL